MPLSTEQKNNRRIGGSSSAAALGLSKYKRPEQLRRELSYSLLGEEAIREYLHDPTEENVQKEIDAMNEDLDNIHIRVGSFLEDFVRNRLKDMGYPIRKKNHYEVHPDYDFITMNIDGRDGDIVEEIKCISIHRKKEFGDEFSNEIAPDYDCQLNHYMIFPKFNHGRLRALFLSDSEKELVDRMIRGLILKHAPEMHPDSAPVEVEIPRYGTIQWDFKKQEKYRIEPSCSMNLDVVKNIVDIAPLKTFEVHYDKEKCDKMIEEYKDIWHRAQHNIPCIPRTLEDCQIIYDGYSSGVSKIANDKVKALVAEKQIIAARMKKDESRLSAIIADLMVEANDADAIQGSDGRILFTLGQKWSPSKDDGPLIEYCRQKAEGSVEPMETILDGYMKTDVVDWKKVEKELPEVYQKCRKKTARNITWPRGK